MAFTEDDHDRLIRLSSDVCWIKTIVGNHLKHHWIITVAALSAAFTAIAGAIVMLLKG